MGRRSLEALDPIEARQAVSRHFRRLTNTAGVNLAQFRAQVHEEEMVQLLVGFTRDDLQTPAFRKECALDVIRIARGPIEPWKHEGNTINVLAIGQTGVTVGQEIEAARRSAGLSEQICDLMMRKVPVDRWPDEVRLAAGDLIAAFTAEDEGTAQPSDSR